jgi:AraC family transcriptional regulator
VGIPHDDPDVTEGAKIRYDACVTVDARFRPEGEVGAAEVAGGEYAVATHRGPYERLGETYRRLYGDWLPASGREARAAPPFEVFRNSPNDTAPEALLTDIYVPLAAR